MKLIQIALLSAVSLALGACQTIEQAGEGKAKAVCSENGHGPGTQHHQYCMRQLTPLATELERQRRARLIQNGAAMIAGSMGNRPAAPEIEPSRNNLENKPIWCMRSNIGNNVVCQ